MPRGDIAPHLQALLVFQEQFLHARGPGDFLAPGLAWMDLLSYPPLTYYVMGQVGAWCGGLDPLGLACLNLLWVAVTALAVYVLGRQLFGGEGKPGQGRAVGLTAALLVTFCPSVLGFVPAFYLDLPATAMLTLALAALAAGREMRSRLLACLAGAAVACAVLTKWSTLVALVPGLVLVGARVWRGATRKERVALARAFALMLLVLGAAAQLVLHSSVRFDGLTEALPREACWWRLIGLTAALVAVAALSATRLRPGPGRNLVLACTVALVLACPFYLNNLDPILRRAARDVREAGTRIEAEADRAPLAEVAFPELAWGLPVPLLVLPGLAWLLLWGPKGSGALVVAPLLANTGLHYAAAVEAPRYYLPGYPLEILAVVASLAGIPRVRAGLVPLLVCLGLWNAGLWLEGRLPLLSGAVRDFLPGSEGSGPASLTGRMGLMLDQVARRTGPGYQALVVLGSIGGVDARGLSAIAMSRRHLLLFRDFERPEVGGLRSASSWGVRFALLQVPPPRAGELSRKVRAPLSALKGSWLLALGPAGGPWRLPRDIADHLGHPQDLSAPEGTQARLYPVVR